jgi:hypothetical protein
MEVDFAKQTEVFQQQTQAMLNKIVQLERQHIYQPIGNNGWDKSKQPQYKKSQIFPTPLDTNNFVDQETLPWCNPRE